MGFEADSTLIKETGRRNHVKCWHCNGDGSDEKTITRRLSPIMRTADGRRQTEESLRAEMKQELDEWRTTKYVHPKCEKYVIEALLKIIDQLDNEAELLREVQEYVLDHRNEPAFAQLIDQLRLAVTETSSTG